MLLSTLDIALRGATVALLLVLAASLVRGFGSVLAGRLAAAFALGSAAHAAELLASAHMPVSTAHAPLIALSTGNVVVFWLFTRALFDDAFKLRCVACAGLGGGRRVQLRQLHVDRAGRGRQSCGYPSSRSTCWRSASLRWRSCRPSRRGPPIWSSGRRRVRVFIVGAAALYGGMNAVLQISCRRRRSAEIANTANSAVLAGIVAAICYRDDARRRRRSVSGRAGACTAGMAGVSTVAEEFAPIKNWSTR